MKKRSGFRVAAGWVVSAVSACSAFSASPALAQAVQETKAAASAVGEYQADVMFLAHPFMEGRGPGTRGNEVAAEFVEARFKGLGLEPAIDVRDRSEPSKQMRMPPNSFRQQFTAGRSATCNLQKLHWGEGDEKSGQVVREVTSLGFSGSGEVSAPLVFVGYAIQGGGPDKSYNTFAKDDDLSGKIAVMLRFEPMNEQGKSLWRKASDGAWTVAAGLSGKIQETLKRGAAGIIIVNTPGADDPRVSKSETTEGTARWMREIDAPAMLVSPDAFAQLLKGVGEKRSGLELRRLADAAGGIMALGDRAASMNVQIERTPRTTWNVAATLPGAGDLAQQYIVIGAHYDHVGYGYTGGSRSDEFGVVHPGADDNASGTAGLLLVARTLKDRFDREPGTPRRSIMFIAFSAEEMGLIGSREFVKNSPIEASRITAMLNLDMIGRLRDGAMELAGTGTAQGFDEILNPLIQASGLNVKRSPGGRGPSDHATFYGAGIPVLHFFTGLHEQYHTPRDTADTINFEGGVQVAKLVSQTAMTLATRPEPLVFVSSQPRAGQEAKDGAPAGPSMANMKVRFGIAPGNYGEENQGVLVDDVFAGTSAAEAGIQKGDVLIKWSGEPIADVAGWMGNLVKHNPGDVVDVTIKRGKEELVVRVTLKSRDQVAR